MYDFSAHSGRVALYQPFPREIVLSIQKTHEARKLFIDARKRKIRGKLYLLPLLLDTDTLSEWPLGVWRAHMTSRDGT
jgi:hypothetical protein